MTVEQFENGMHIVQNGYSRVVTDAGNVTAQKMVDQVFEICDRNWRGIGMIPQSGLRLRQQYSFYDAERRFSVQEIKTQESAICQSGQILQGILKPNQCPAFGKECTPKIPLGATMVSSEGACNAYYRYRLTSDAKG